MSASFQTKASSHNPFDHFFVHKVRTDGENLEMGRRPFSSARISKYGIKKVMTPATLTYRDTMPGSRSRRGFTTHVNQSAGQRPSLKATTNDEQLQLTAEGSWIVKYTAEIEKLIEQAVHLKASFSQVQIDFGRIQSFDSYGAVLAQRLVGVFGKEGPKVKIVGVSKQQRAMVGEAFQSTSSSSSRSPKSKGNFAAFERVGVWLIESANSFNLLMQLLGEVSTALLRIAARPGAMRFTSMVNHMDHVGLRAVPIVVLITFLVGGIIAQQGTFYFRAFGADVYVVDMVGVLVLREIGVLLVCIMVAGRSGSAYTAELGAMKMREEIDALRTMGLDPIDVLILPRIVAIVLVVPILTFLGSVAALYGGGLVCWLYGGMNPEIFLARLREAISLNTFEVGMIKAPFMGLIIGLVACVEGLKTKSSAESLGLRTTDSVVKAIFLVIVMDGLFAMFFAAIDK